MSLAWGGGGRESRLVGPFLRDDRIFQEISYFHHEENDHHTLKSAAAVVVLLRTRARALRTEKKSSYIAGRLRLLMPLL